MDRSIKASGRTLTQGMFMQPWALNEHLAELAARYRVTRAAPEPTAALAGRLLPSLCATGTWTLISATRSDSGQTFSSLCGKCYDWPGERVDHAEWVARRRGEV